jgi:hypothetical protein
MRHSLKYVSFLLLLLLMMSCGKPYRHLQPSAQPMVSALRFRPEFTKEVYRCIVDGKVLFKKFHLSGLLLFKTFEDGSTRAVFQNEMGFSFFDFRWDEKDAFEVMSIIPQLNKPALIKLLKKDMNLVLMKNLDAATEAVFVQQDETYNRFSLEKGYAYYISKDGVLQRIENAGKSKVITIEPHPKRSGNTMPDALLFKHHKAHFTIDLKKIIPENAQ